MNIQKLYTKKDLAEKFGICHRSVMRNLSALGFNTRRRHYTEAEVERFARCRKLIESGYTYAQTLEAIRLREVEIEE